MKNPSPRTFDFARAEAHLKRIDELAAQRKKQRQQGRRQGDLSKSLYDGLRACNVPQLKRVKTLCDRFIEQHRRPPEEFECSERYIMKVLASVCVKNKRYRLEMRRGSLRRKTVYLNGPYLYAYWRDGNLIRKQYLKKGKGVEIPRKVKAAIKLFSSSTVIEEQFRAIIKEVEDQEQSDATNAVMQPV